MQRTILGFDTSAINALHRADRTLRPYSPADTDYAIRLNGTALDEIVAHSLPQERERLPALPQAGLRTARAMFCFPSTRSPPDWRWRSKVAARLTGRASMFGPMSTCDSYLTTK